MRLVPAAAVIIALAGQQPPVTQPLKSSIDLVRVDVSAVDGEGRPIPDLTAADFDLRVDRRHRPIVTVQFVAVPAGSDHGPPTPEHYSTNAGAAGGRLIMIVVDRTSVATGRAKPALEAASAFVGSLPRTDRVALATIPEGPQVPFTADHALVRRLILNIEGTAVASFGMRNIGIADALAFERRDARSIQLITERECGTNSGGRSGSSELLTCQGEVKSEALQVVADARARARQTVAGLQRLLASFPPSQTPKILAFISEGLVTSGEPSLLSWLDTRAAAAHVTIYPLHLEPSENDASLRQPAVNPAADRAQREHGLVALAQSTGGDLFRIISHSDFAFRRLSAELSGYYLLGFEPEPRERDGLPHAIAVDVRRRGVTVRSRRQFTIPAKVDATPETEIVAALRDPLPAVDIPLTLTTYSFYDPRLRKMRLFLAAEIDRPADDASRIAAGYVVVDFNGKLVASRMDAALPAPAVGGLRIQRYFSEVAIEPGKYTVKLAAVDGSGRRGSVERVAVVRMSEAGPVRATDLLLGEGSDQSWALPLAPAVTGEIAGGSLHGYIELFADRPAAFDQVSVTLEIAAADTSAPLTRVPVQLDMPADNPLCRVAPARVDLARLPPGDYVARAVIAVGLRVVGQVDRPFRIVPPSRTHVHALPPPLSRPHHHSASASSSRGDVGVGRPEVKGGR